MEGHLDAVVGKRLKGVESCCSAWGGELCSIVLFSGDHAYDYIGGVIEKSLSE